MVTLCADAIMESSFAQSPAQITSLMKNMLISNIRHNFEPMQLPGMHLLQHVLYKRKKKRIYMSVLSSLCKEISVPVEQDKY